MFQSKTGWGGVVVTLIGALTATDTLPLVSEFLTASVGAKAAHLVGLALTLSGVVVAKLSHAYAPTPPAGPSEP